MPEFQCQNQASSRQTRMAGHPGGMLRGHQYFCTAGTCRVSNEAGEVAGSALSGLPGPFNPDQEGPFKSLRQEYKFPRAAIINYHKLGGSRQHIYFLEARSPKPRCQWGCISSKGSRAGSFSCLF